MRYCGHLPAPIEHETKHVSSSLKLLKGGRTEGSTYGTFIERDTKSLDYSSCDRFCFGFWRFLTGSGAFFNEFALPELKPSKK